MINNITDIVLYTSIYYKIDRYSSHNFLIFNRLRNLFKDSFIGLFKKFFSQKFIKINFHNRKLKIGRVFRENKTRSNVCARLKLPTVKLAHAFLSILHFS